MHPFTKTANANANASATINATAVVGTSNATDQKISAPLDGKASKTTAVATINLKDHKAPRKEMTMIHANACSFEKLPVDLHLHIQSFLKEKDKPSMICSRLMRECGQIMREYASRLLIEEPLLLHITAASNVDVRIKTKDPLLIKHQNTFPIILATRINSYRCTEALIKRGAKVNIADDFGNTPFHYAMRHADPDIIRKLLERDDLNNSGLTKPNNFGFLPSTFVQRRQNSREVQCFTLYQRHITEKIPNFIEQVRRYQLGFMRPAQVKKIVMSQKSAEFNSVSNVIAAMLEDYIDDQKDDMDQKRANTQTIVHWAVLSGSHRILETILKFNSYGIEGNKVEIEKKVQITLSNFINQQDRNGNTPLHLATIRQDEKAVKLLLEHGAFWSMSDLNSRRLSPIDYVAKYIEEKGNSTHSAKRASRMRSMKTWAFFNTTGVEIKSRASSIVKHVLTEYDGKFLTESRPYDLILEFCSLPKPKL